MCLPRQALHKIHPLPPVIVPASSTAHLSYSTCFFVQCLPLPTGHKLHAIRIISTLLTTDPQQPGQCPTHRRHSINIVWLLIWYHNGIFSNLLSSLGDALLSMYPSQNITEYLRWKETETLISSNLSFLHEEAAAQRDLVQVHQLRPVTAVWGPGSPRPG